LSLKRLAFDVFGDSVNLASRMESTSAPSCIRVSEATWAQLEPSKYLWEPEEVHVKGKGLVSTILIRGRAPSEPDNVSPAFARRQSEPAIPTSCLRHSTDIDLSFPNLRRSCDIDFTFPSLRKSGDLEACIPKLRRSGDLDLNFPMLRRSGERSGEKSPLMERERDALGRPAKAPAH